MTLNPLHVNRHHIGDGGMYIDAKVDSALLDFAVVEQAVGEVEVHLHVVLAETDLVVRGKAKACFSTTCDRCLGEYEMHVCAEEICEVIEECSDMTDLTDIIREDILLTFPQISLCSPDCEGLCSGCGVNLNHEDCKCSDDEDEDESDGDESDGTRNPFAQVLKDFKI